MPRNCSISVRVEFSNGAFFSTAYKLNSSAINSKTDFCINLSKYHFGLGISVEVKVKYSPAEVRCSSADADLHCCLVNRCLLLPVQ